MAKCVQCACVRNNTTCLSCLPGDSGNCHNRQPSGHATASSPVTTPQCPHIASTQSIQAGLPSLNITNTSRVPTLYHVPKGARDSWSRVVGEVLQEIVIVQNCGSSGSCSLVAFCTIHLEEVALTGVKL